MQGPDDYRRKHGWFKRISPGAIAQSSQEETKQVAPGDRFQRMFRDLQLTAQARGLDLFGRREHQSFPNLQFRGFTNASQQGEPVHDRHVSVNNDQRVQHIVVHGLVEQGQRLGSAGGKINDHAPSAQHALEDTAVGGVVVDDQDAHAAQDLGTDKDFLSHRQVS